MQRTAYEIALNVFVCKLFKSFFSHLLFVQQNYLFRHEYCSTGVYYILLAISIDYSHRTYFTQFPPKGLQLKAEYTESLCRSHLIV